MATNFPHIALSLFLAGGSVGPRAPQEMRLNTSHFSICYRAEQRAFAEDLERTADLLRAKVLDELGAIGPDKTKVYLTGSSAEMQAAAPEGVEVPSWAVGLAFPRLNLILLKTTGDSGSVTDLEKVFLHEWSHLALEHAVDFRPVPRWFREGFAIYQSGEWSFGRVRILTTGVLSGRLFSLEALSGQFPSSIAEVELAYAQSIDFVSFLLGKYGKQPFQRMITLLAQGFTFFQALEEAYDQGIFTIEEAWYKDLKFRFTWIPLITGTATLWFLATLVFLAAFFRKRRKKMEALERLDAEDNIQPPFPPGSG